MRIDLNWPCACFSETLQDDFNSYKVNLSAGRKSDAFRSWKWFRFERRVFWNSSNRHNENEHRRSWINKWNSRKRSRDWKALFERRSNGSSLDVSVRSSTEHFSNKMQLLISENEILQKEQDRLVEAQAKLIHESRKREQDLRKQVKIRASRCVDRLCFLQHQSEIDKIESDHLQRTNESHEMMKNITLQNETLSIAFKVMSRRLEGQFTSFSLHFLFQEQIAAIESDHERSIVFVQNQLQTARQEIEQLKARLETVRQNNLESEKISFPSPDSASIGINNHSNRDDILAWSASERQQGEVIILLSSWSAILISSVSEGKRNSISNEDSHDIWRTSSSFLIGKRQPITLYLRIDAARSFFIGSFRE